MKLSIGILVLYDVFGLKFRLNIGIGKTKNGKKSKFVRLDAVLCHNNRVSHLLKT